MFHRPYMSLERCLVLPGEEIKQMDSRFFRNVILKALLLFIILNLVLVFMPDKSGAEQVSLYNHFLPGRQRFPFGEAAQQAYNFSLYDLDTMFAAHEVSAPAAENEVRVFLLGDSSVWGTLLTTEDNLSGQLNAANATCNGKTMRFYNLGYPTISLTKDLMVLQRAMRYEPDLILWLTTLEAFPLEKQLASPLAENNPQRIQPLVNDFDLPLTVNPLPDDLLSRSLWGRRRAIADWLRLQAYGVMWAATGVDQIYPPYEPAAWDQKDDNTFQEFEPPHIPVDQLLWQALPAAKEIAKGVPLILVNEPIMISTGENSDIRYNFFYPRWAYDSFRGDLEKHSLESGIPLIDVWNQVDASQFTNSAIHLTPQGEKVLAEMLLEKILQQTCH